MGTKPLDLGTAPLSEIAKMGGAGTPLPKVAAFRKQQAENERLRAEGEQKNRKIGGTPPAEPPVPPAIAQRVTLAELPAVREMLERGVRLAAEREALTREDAEADAAHERERERERGRRIERQAAAITSGESLPSSDKEVLAERQYLAGKEARRVRMESLALAAVKLRERGEVQLAADIRQRQAASRDDSAVRMRQVAEKLREVLALMAEEEAMERAALGQIGRVQQALARFPLGPAIQVIPGAERTGTWRTGAPVSLGREPDVRRELDSPARRTIRSFIEDHRIGMPRTATRKLWQLLSPDRLREAVTAALEGQ